MAEIVRYALQDRVATLTMDDGKVNVLSPQMQLELNRALDRASQDGATVVLQGREQRFSAGFDLAVLRGGGQAARDMLIGGFRLAERLLSFPTPVVAACTGHALAMGSFLLLSADVRIGVSGPFKIGANEVAIGMTLPWAAIEILRQRLTPGHLVRAAITAEIYDPEQAVTAGFLDHVVPAAELPATASKLASGLAQLDMRAHVGSKLRVREGMLAALRAAIEQDDSELRARL